MKRYLNSQRPVATLLKKKAVNDLEKYALYNNPINRELINNHIQLSLRCKRKTANTESGLGDLIYQRNTQHKWSVIQKKNNKFGNFHHVSPAPQHPQQNYVFLKNSGNILSNYNNQSMKNRQRLEYGLH